METYPNALSVRMIEEYFYCPMLIHYKYVLGIKKPPSLWSTLGLQVQEELSGYVEENYRVIGRQVRLESKKHGLVGVVDYIVEYSGGHAPLEIKYSGKLRPWWKYTLIAYAILIEENYGRPVKIALLVTPGPTTKILTIRENDRKYLEKTVRKIKRILDGKDQAKPHPSRTCRNCDYKDICQYKTQ